MQDNLEYIDDYFNGERTPGQTREFEQRIIDDPKFAGDVSFYLATIQTAKEIAAEEKKTRFKQIHENHKGEKNSHPEGGLRKLWPYMAAAAVLAGIIIGIYLFNNNKSLQQQAGNYISSQLQALPVTMSSTEDSMQKAIRLFNDGKLEEALASFEMIGQIDTSSFTAKKYAGIVSLRLQQYDKALDYFTQLGNYPGLYANPGLFLQAVTLVKRNRPGDEQQARQLLQQVIDNDFEGKEAANDWLGK